MTLPTDSTTGTPGEGNREGVPVVDLDGVLADLYLNADNARALAGVLERQARQWRAHSDYLEDLARVLSGGASEG